MGKKRKGGPQSIQIAHPHSLWVPSSELAAYVHFKSRVSTHTAKPGQTGLMNQQAQVAQMR